MKSSFIAIALIVAGGGFAATRASSAAPGCNVRGVWRATRATLNGRPVTSITEVKVLTKNHFMWVQDENRRDTLPLRTFRDTARVFNNAGGYGTYRVSGNKYIEHIEQFPDPTFIGKEWPATCRTTRNEWIHSYVSPERTDSTGRTRRDTVVEFFARIE
jgi:hypothetical protein